MKLDYEKNKMVVDAICDEFERDEDWDENEPKERAYKKLKLYRYHIFV